MAFPKKDSEPMSAEALTEYFKVLAGGDEADRVLLAQGMIGTGIAKVEGVGEDQGGKELVELVEEALVGMLRSNNPEDKKLAILLGLKFYRGMRSARIAAAENNAAE
jgi:hypothetical protein